MRKKGFTLVEVIVVAVIVAILAAVAIPMYRNYIQNAALSAAEQVAVSLSSAVAAEKMNGVTVAAFQVASNAGDVQQTIGSNTVTIPRGMTVSTAITASQGTFTVTHNGQNQSFTKVIGL